MAKFKPRDKVRAVGRLRRTEALHGLDEKMKEIVKAGKVLTVDGVYGSPVIVAAEGWLWDPSDLRKVRGRKAR